MLPVISDKGEDVRRLIAAVEQKAESGGSFPPGLEQWLARATSLADQLDPTAAGLADMLTRHEEESTKEAERAPRWGG